MKNKNRLHSVSDFCKKNGYEIYWFYYELRKAPGRADRLCRNSKGEYVVDTDTLKYIGDRLRIRKEKEGDKALSEYACSAEGAVAAEINRLVSENEKLKKELRRLGESNRRLRDKAETRKMGKLKSEKVEKNQNSNSGKTEN